MGADSAGFQGWQVLVLRARSGARGSGTQGPEGHGGVKKATAVKTGSDAGGPKGATGTLSTERPVTHHLSSTLQEFVGSVGIGDPKTCWLVDSVPHCF